MIIICHADNSRIWSGSIYRADRFQLLCTLLERLFPAVTAALGFPHAPGLCARTITDHLRSPLACKEINKLFLIRLTDQVQLCKIICSIQPAADHLCKKHAHIIGNNTLLRRIQVSDLPGLLEPVSLCIQCSLHKKQLIKDFQSAFLKICRSQSLDRHSTGDDRMKEFFV